MTKKAKILEYLKIVAPILPAPIYWENVNSVILGGNEPIFKASGAMVHDAYVGKTLYELYPETAEHIKQHNEEVMKTGEILSQEEVISDITTGEIKYFMAIKAPLRDDEGNVIGIVGTSIDITAEKEAERLRLENEAHKVQLQAQENFTKIAAQVAHDIKSPTASLLMLLKSCQDIPEKERIALREATMRIQDIASNLLSHYLQQDSNRAMHNEERESILVSALMLELLAEKKLQYQDLAIKIDDYFSQTGHFAFVKIEPSAFKRMLSNLVNNAVDAFEDNQEGRVVVKLDADEKWVKVSIEDNGKGMRPELVDKIMNNVAVTEGKEGGHGLGLTQVRETLQRNQGELEIESKIGQGTKITLTFPRIKASEWIAEEVKLTPNDIVVILDDDNSIHGAWDAHFEPILENAPAIQLKHFTIGKEALAFINALSADERKKVFLLSDYELLKQDLNGLDVIEKSKLQRSILVTSHYANQSVRKRAEKVGTKILPKLLASEIPIKINKSPANKKQDAKANVKQADIVIVDDDQSFIRNLIMFAFSEQNVDEYYDPQKFLDNLDKYSKNTKICLDNNFGHGMRGIDVAKCLHDQGFTQIYMLSGENFNRAEVPSYLTLIMKDDLDAIKKI